eukprot:SAG31_NODE_981_length_10558_cov_2.972273_11_plen_119_part_00
MAHNHQRKLMGITMRGPVLDAIPLLMLVLSLDRPLGIWAQHYTEWSGDTAGKVSMRDRIRFGMYNGTIDITSQTYYCDYTATGVQGRGYSQITNIATSDELHAICANWCDAVVSYLLR